MNRKEWSSVDLRGDLRKMMDVALGRRKASLVLKGGTVVNVFMEKTEVADIAIEDGYIAGIRDYEGEHNVDLLGRYTCPGLIDGHIHIESAMVSPPEFEKTVLPHGTTAVIADPHEIGNVAGCQGIDYMPETIKDLDLDVSIMMSPCVPATALDESGTVLGPEGLKPYYDNPRMLGLAEVMNSLGVTAGTDDLMGKLSDAGSRRKVVDGHAPFLEGSGLNAYVCARVFSDHECSDIDEVLKKLGKGQYVMVKEGTAARNLEALMPLFATPYYEHRMLVTDDKHPGDLTSMRHTDYIIRKTVSLGADPIKAIKMGTFHSARYFSLEGRGAVMSGLRADLAVLEDLKGFRVLAMYKDGKLAAEKGVCTQEKEDKNRELASAFPRVFDSFHLGEITLKDLELVKKGAIQRVIQFKPHELLTQERILPWPDDDTAATQGDRAQGMDLNEDIVKAAVSERHLHTGHTGVGLIGGYGLKKDAVATSVAHDSHNLTVIGTNDRDMVLAVNAVRKNRGGLAVTVDGQVTGELALPIGGIVTQVSVYEVEFQLEKLKEQTRELGINEDIDAFVTPAFVSLPVIPKLRINSYGVIDVDRQEVVEAIF